MSSAHLLIIGDRAALSWVVTEQRMAFRGGLFRGGVFPGAGRTLEEGDEVFVGTTRGCFRNPTRDLGRVIGRATVASPVRVLDEPVVFNGRPFSEGCRLKVSGPARLREGLVLRDLVPRRPVFPDLALYPDSADDPASASAIVADAAQETVTERLWQAWRRRASEWPGPGGSGGGRPAPGALPARAWPGHASAGCGRAVVLVTRGRVVASRPGSCPCGRGRA
jgi:hypothetical protein